MQRLSSHLFKQTIGSRKLWSLNTNHVRYHDHKPFLMSRCSPRFYTSTTHAEMEIDEEVVDKKLSKLTPMMHQYFTMKQQHKDYLLLFRMGDFYELFFDDAVKASEVLHLNLTRRGKLKGKDIQFAGFPHVALESYLRKLMKAGISVAVCEQLEHPKRDKLLAAQKLGTELPIKPEKKSKLVEREVTRIVTPGTITEDSFLDARENNYLVSLSFPQVAGKTDKKDIVIGFSWVEISTGEFQITRTNLASLRSDLMRLSPSEVLIPKMDSHQYQNLPQLRQMLQDYHITHCNKDTFNSDNGRDLLNERFPTLSTDDLSPIELASSNALLTYVLETQKGTLPYLDTPQTANRERFLSIDTATRSSLELNRTLSGDRRGSLMHTIDRTVTAPGARLLAYRLQSPLVDAKQIKDRLDCVDFFIGDLTMIEEAREIMKKAQDIERCLQRLNLSRGGPRDLASIAETLKQAESLHALILSSKKSAPTLIQQEIDALLPEEHTFIAFEILSALKDVSELPATIIDGGFIRHGYSQELDEYITIRTDSNLLIDDLQAKYRQLTGITTLKIKETGVMGYCVEIPNSKQATISKFPEFHQSQTLTQSVRYKTAELNQLQVKINSAEGIALEVEYKLFAELQKLVVNHSESLIRSAKALAAIDVYSALALLARERNYKRPNVLNDQDIKFNIVGARHPTVELAQLESGVGSFVSNDCHMSAKKSRIMLITGPNMGGKSTFLRQNALIIILAQAGCYVPADMAEFNVVDKLFSRVGAMDNLAKDQSTFMVEMVETANILTQATAHSFVIMDEVGRGTATQDGLAIAWSIVEYLHNVIKCRALFATHYHELTDIQEKLSDSVGLYTLQVREDKNRELAFLYKIVAGVTERSFGVHVAQLAGVPKPVTDRAEQILKRLEEQHRRFKIE